MTAIASMGMVNLDCDDPHILAAFYRQVLGWEVAHESDDYAMLSNGSVMLGFGRVKGYTPPNWPNETEPKRYHLDFYVDDYDKAEAALLALGAKKPEFQPGADRWRVLLDPAGHPFCICLKSE
ncbi:VOC family protein [Rhizohabitans arisaemae]|uniref:VOC family protein n=1 Tax=Rhizohabitans arisaemae TaxID=2720610 RepID=UPI0024B0FDFD|nr:VOC family protein [Rhizohabitans arisaemae]